MQVTKISSCRKVRRKAANKMSFAADVMSLLHSQFQDRELVATIGEQLAVKIRMLAEEAECELRQYTPKVRFGS